MINGPTPVRDTPSIAQADGLEEVPGETAEGVEPASSIAGEEEISLLDLLIVMVRHRRLIFRMAIGMGLAGLILSLVLPSRYTAQTSVLPPQQNTSTGAAFMAQLGSLGSMASMAGGGLGLKNPNDLQVAMLKSRTVEDAMIVRSSNGS
jgi:tyrosine-protein kinase Etk/Wzc